MIYPKAGCFIHCFYYDISGMNIFITSVTLKPFSLFSQEVLAIVINCWIAGAQADGNDMSLRR